VRAGAEGAHGTGLAKGATHSARAQQHAEEGQATTMAKAGSGKGKAKSDGSREAAETWKTTKTETAPLQQACK
jgi:hypothetical protein